MFPRICAGSTHTLLHPHLTRCRQMRSGCQKAACNANAGIHTSTFGSTTSYIRRWKKRRKQNHYCTKTCHPSELPPLLYTGLLSSVIFFYRATELRTYHQLFVAAKATAMRAGNPGLIRSVSETEWKFPKGDLIG